MQENDNIVTFQIIDDRDPRPSKKFKPNILKEKMRTEALRAAHGRLNEQLPSDDLIFASQQLHHIKQEEPEIKLEDSDFTEEDDPLILGPSVQTHSLPKRVPVYKPQKCLIYQPAVSKELSQPAPLVLTPVPKSLVLNAHMGLKNPLTAPSMQIKLIKTNKLAEYAGPSTVNTIPKILNTQTGLIYQRLQDHVIKTRVKTILQKPKPTIIIKNHINNKKPAEKSKDKCETRSEMSTSGSSTVDNNDSTPQIVKSHPGMVFQRLQDQVIKSPLEKSRPKPTIIVSKQTNIENPKEKSTDKSALEIAEDDLEKGRLQPTLETSNASTLSSQDKEPNPCKVKNCRGGSKQFFPISQKNLSAWLFCLQQSDLQVNDLVCKNHFLEEYVKKGRSEDSPQILTENAIPWKDIINGCCVPDCPNAIKNTKTMYHIPAWNYFDTWLNKIKNPIIATISRDKGRHELLKYRVCEIHFEKNNFIRYPILYPSLHLPDGARYYKNLLEDYYNRKNILPLIPVSSNETVTDPLDETETLRDPVKKQKGFPEKGSNKETTGLNTSINDHFDTNICSFKGCSTRGDAIHVAFFKFPIDYSRAERWLLTFGRQDILSRTPEEIKTYMTQSVGVCSAHLGAKYVDKPEKPRTSTQLDTANNTMKKIIEERKAGKCAYFECNTTYRAPIRKYRFPSDFELFKSWTKAVGISNSYNQQDLKCWFVCERHFSKKQFNMNGSLVLTAVPEPCTYTDLSSSQNQEHLLICNVQNCENPSKILHEFPNRLNHPFKFNIWMKATGNHELIRLPDYIDFSFYRICDNHFEDKYKNGEELMINAVPTLDIRRKPALQELMHESLIVNDVPPLDISNPVLEELLKEKLIANDVPTLDISNTVPQDLLNEPVLLTSENEKIDTDSLKITWKECKNHNFTVSTVNGNRKGKCILLEDRIEFPDMEKQVQFGKGVRKYGPGRLPCKVFKFCKDTGKIINKHVMPGHKLEIHTAIIVDDDDKSEREAIMRIASMLKKNKQLTNPTLKN